jgi:threonine dehydrogenase-like Zn-dependent dehydrogenase
MEAHGSRGAEAAQRLVGVLPDRLAAPLMEKGGLDRLAALHTAIDLVRRGGTLSIVGVYAGAVDPMPMLQLFDKGVTIRMGQAHVRRWTDALLPLVTDEADPLGVLDLATHQIPLEQAPNAYQMFQEKKDGAIKVVLKP